jgi:hypothetical protein
MDKKKPAFNPALDVSITQLIDYDDKTQESSHKLPSSAKAKPLIRLRKYRPPRITLKYIDTLAAIAGISGIAIAYYENEDFYSTSSSDGAKERNESTDYGNALRGINMLVTLILEIFIILHYVFKLKIMKLEGDRPPHDSIKTSGLLPKMLMEMLLCAICTPPKMDMTFEGTMLGGSYVYSYNAIIFCVMLLRVYLLFRLIGQFSRWTNKEAQKICRQNKTHASIHFALKSEFKDRPFLMIGIMIGVCLVVLGSAFRAMERSFVGSASLLDFEYMTNVQWVLIITMMTVGYGEAFPATHMGRLIAAVACIIGLVLVSLTVIGLLNLTSLTSQEMKSYHIINILRHRKNVESKASDVIKYALKFHRDKNIKKGDKRLENMFIDYIQLINKVRIYSNDYLLASTYEIPEDDQIVGMQEKIEDDVYEMREMMKEMLKSKPKMMKLTDRQQRLSDMLAQLAKEQERIAAELIKVHNMFG